MVRNTIWSLLVIAAAGGCTSSEGRVGHVSGTIALGDELLKSDDRLTWSVTFISSEKDAQTGGLVGRDGKYSVENVPAGPARIVVAGMPQMGIAFDKKTGSRPKLDADQQQVLKQLERFKDPERSGLHYAVTEGRQTHNIRLELP